MDLASLIGLIGAVGMILAAMIAGGGVAPLLILNQSSLSLVVHFLALCTRTHFQFS